MSDNDKRVRGQNAPACSDTAVGFVRRRRRRRRASRAGGTGSTGWRRHGGAGRRDKREIHGQKWTIALALWRATRAERRGQCSRLALHKHNGAAKAGSESSGIHPYSKARI